MIVEKTKCIELNVNVYNCISPRSMLQWRQTCANALRWRTCDQWAIHVKLRLMQGNNYTRLWPSITSNLRKPDMNCEKNEHLDYHPSIEKLTWNGCAELTTQICENVISKRCENFKMGQFMRLWYLSHRRTAKAQARLCIRAVSPKPSLFAHIKCGSRRTVWPKTRRGVPVDCCAGVFEEWIYGGQKVPKSHEVAQIRKLSLSYEKTNGEEDDELNKMKK